MEQARMDYRLDKRQQEIRLQEMKAKQLEDAVARREQALSVKEASSNPAVAPGMARSTSPQDEDRRVSPARRGAKGQEDELELKRRNSRPSSRHLSSMPGQIGTRTRRRSWKAKPKRRDVKRETNFAAWRPP